MTQTNVQEMADKIVDAVNDAGDYVSIAEVKNRIGDSVYGNFMFVHEDTNVVMFVGVSELFTNALRLLLDERPHRIHLARFSLLALMFDGCPVPTNIPFVKKSIPRSGYKKEHFMPTGFRPARMDPCTAACKRNAAEGKK